MTNFICRSTSNPKCHVTFSNTELNVNWHVQFIFKCHLNFGLHNILEILVFWIIKIQSWFVSERYQSSVSILRSRMFLQMLKMLAQSIASTSRPQRKTRIRASRVFEFNVLRKWLLIAFCLKNPLTNSYTWWNEYDFLPKLHNFRSICVSYQIATTYA